MNKRICGLDLYRIIACSFVIINHCNSKVLLQVVPGSIAWYVSLGVIFITKICVPGFLMITGYNLLHRKEDFKTYTGRIIRIAVVLAVFTLFYFVWKCITGRAGIQAYDEYGTVLKILGVIGGYFSELWKGGATDAFWYLYLYLGLLILMPLFQTVAGLFAGAGVDIRTGAGSDAKTGAGSDGGVGAGADAKTSAGADTGVDVDADAGASVDVKDSAENSRQGLGFKQLVIITALSSVYICVIPAITVFFPELSHSEFFELPMLTVGVLYLFIGHLFWLSDSRIGAGEGIKKRDAVYVAVFVCAFLINIVMALTQFKFTGGERYTSFSEIDTPGMLAMSIAAFALALKVKGTGKLGKFVGAVSPATFGIYLFADFMCSNTHMIYYYLCQYMNRLFAVAIQEITAFAAALILTLLLRKIPGVSKFI